jgi:hypothetical protein
MQKEINLLQMQEARRLIIGLNTNSKAEIDSRNSAVEIGGSDVAELTMSPPTMPAEPESLKSAKLPG